MTKLVAVFCLLSFSLSALAAVQANMALDTAEQNSPTLESFRQRIFSYGFDIKDVTLPDGRQAQKLTIPTTARSKSFFNLRAENDEVMLGQFANFSFQASEKALELNVEVHYAAPKYNERLSIRVDLIEGQVKYLSREYGKQDSQTGNYTYATGIAEAIARWQERNRNPSQNRLQIDRLNSRELLFRLSHPGFDPKIIGLMTLPNGASANLAYGRYLIVGFGDGAQVHDPTLGLNEGNRAYKAVVFDLADFLASIDTGQKKDINYLAVYDSSGSPWANCEHELSTGVVGSGFFAHSLQDVIEQFLAR